jgi:G patch domain-containing protein 1
MYGESSRPVYTKSRTTKRRDRFHGAFRGGFSAGHFNTVGSSKGWKPEYNDEEQDQHDVGKKKTLKPSSKVLDYMDEEDANDWGGPSSLKQKFQTNHDSSSEVKDDVTHIQQLFHDEMKPYGNESFGMRLLRALGWRKQKDGHTVYLPMEEDDDEWFQTDRTKEPIHKIANKKLKRVELKINEQMQKKIPPPKTDVHGIGFNPFQNAPEFQKHKEMRRKRAQLRALAATSQGGDYRDNVYRTSDLENLSKEKDERSSDHYFMKHKSVRESNESQTNVLAYETTEDSIGTKTFSGLHFMTTMNMYKMINFIEKMTNMYKMIIFIEKMTMHQKGCISICISIQTNTIPRYIKTVTVVWRRI